MLDNVVDIANLPLQSQRDELIRKRRHGIGYLGLGSMFNMMKIRYGSDESVKLTKKISKILAETSIRAGIDLAKEKGPAPIMNEMFVITPELIAKNPRVGDLYKVDEEVSGKNLLVLSDYMQRFPEDILNEIREHGMRFSHATSIAPTGTMALGIGNNTSNGIEPTFEHEAIRNIIKTGKKTKEATTVYSYEALLYKSMFGETSQLPNYFESSSSVTPLEHVRIQAAAQPYIDSAISKCIAKGTRIITDKGLLKIESFSNNKNAGEFEELTANVKALCSDGNYYKIESHYYDGLKPTKKITFDNGITKEVSLTHRFILENDLKWESAANLKIGDKILYKAATPLNFSSFKHDNYGIIHGILQNPEVKITQESISTKLKFIDLNKFCNVINSLKNLDLKGKNGHVPLNEVSYNFINKLRYEFSWNKLFKISLSERRNYLNNIRTRIIVNDDEELFFENFESNEIASNISELLYTVGRNAVVVGEKGVIELNKKYFKNDIIPSIIVNIEDSENELWDVSVDEKHEYLIHGFISHNTINCPTDISKDDFKNIYLNAYDSGLKGCTTFRFNPEAFQGVIVKQNDLKNTKYKVVFEDDSELVLSGDELVTYDNNDSTIANLYDALKEGYYGKF
jgi:hypothetical protein